MFGYRLRLFILDVSLNGILYFFFTAGDEVGFVSLTLILDHLC